MRTICTIMGVAMVFGFALKSVAQESTVTFNGYRGDVPIWTDRITVEQGKITDQIDGIGNHPDREALTLPGTVTGEIFAEKANGLPVHSIVVKGEFVNVYDGQGMTGMVGVEAPPLAFDPSFPSHYGMLLARYDRAKGGTQKIAVVVPEKADYWQLEIAPKPPVTLQLGEEKKESKVYQVRIDYHQYVTVWTLDDAVAAVYVPSGDEYMVDAKYPMLQQKIQMLVKRSI